MNTFQKFCSLFATALTACAFLPLGALADDDPGRSIEVQGKPLSDWVAQATAENGPENLDQTIARTEGVPVGFLTHKTEYLKPSRKGDVVWGFDPYRFDWAEMRRAVRWVLGEYFGLVMRN